MIWSVIGHTFLVLTRSTTKVARVGCTRQSDQTKMKIGSQTARSEYDNEQSNRSEMGDWRTGTSILRATSSKTITRRSRHRRAQCRCGGAVVTELYEHDLGEQVRRADRLETLNTDFRGRASLTFVRETTRGRTAQKSKI